MDKHRFKYRCVRIATSGIACLGVVIGLDSFASHTSAEATEAGADVGARRVGYVTQPFSGGVTLDQARTLESPTPDAVVGYRIDNGEIVGEYMTLSGQSPSEFRADFFARYGTEPRVSGFVVEGESPSRASASRRSSVDPAPIETSLPDFTPAPVPADRKAALEAEGGSGATGPSLFSGSYNWKPSNVSSKIKRSGTHQYFDMTVGWYAGTSPTGIDARFGLEAGIDLYNDATGTRGSILPGEICGPGFRDQFIAKNYDWYSWSVFSPNGSLSASSPYADINDLSDPCGRNSMAIGFKDPQKFPGDAFGMYEIATHIDAQVGVTSSSRIGGGIQLVDKVNCSWGFSLTDCMGTGLLEGETRFTLGTTRNWVADPNKCWTSGGNGDVAPVAVTCP
jgi:hypothetical protein